MRRLVWFMAALMVLALPLLATAQTQAGSVTGVVTDASGAVLPGATVTIKSAGGAVLTAVTDATGHYAIANVAPGAYELTIEMPGFDRQVSKIAVAAGQPFNTETKLQIAAQTETVQVTGSLIPRPTLEAMAPVTTMDVQELSYRGINRIEDILISLPQVFAAQNSTRSNGASGTATVDLRYLGTNRTQVLLDGRRLGAGDPFEVAPDLNFIPEALVKRVDILTGGASATYGADAVAGVVNFILDKTFEGVRGGFQQSGYQHNNNNAIAQQINKAAGFTPPSGNVWNGAPSDFNVAFGGKFGERKGHASVYFDYRTTPAITKDSRDYTNCALTGGLDESGPYCSGSSTWQYGKFQTFNADFSRSVTYVLDPTTNQLRVRNPSTDVYNYAPANFMQRNDKRWAGGGFMNYQVNPRAEVYGEVMFMDDRSDAQIAPSGSFNSATQINCNNPMLSAQQVNLLCTQMGYGPNDVANVFIARRNVEGGGRVDSMRHQDIRFDFGLKGDLNKAWNYDIYGLQSQVSAPHSYLNELNSTNIQNAVLVTGNRNDPSSWQCEAGAPCVPYNVFTLNGVTPAALTYLRLPMLEDTGTRTRVLSGRLSGDLKNYGIAFPSASEGIKIAAGFEYRSERLFVDPDIAYQSGIGAGQGGPVLGVDGSYTAKEFFAEGLIPIAQEGRGVRDLSVELGYRLSNYYLPATSHQVGDKMWPTYKVMGSWSPTADLKVRLGFNRATRSPNIVELFTPQGLGLNGGIDICAGAQPTASQAACAAMGVPAGVYGSVTENPAEQYNTWNGGNANLSPEIADSYTAGVVIAPSKLPGFTAAIDYYQVKIKNTIGAYGADDVQRQCADSNGTSPLCGLVHRDAAYSLWLVTNGPQSGLGYTETIQDNIGKLESKGIDFNATYTRSLGGKGLLTVNLIGTYLLDSITDTGLFTYDCVGYFGLSSSGGCQIPTPKWRHLARFTWEKGKTSVTAGWRLIGSVLNDAAMPSGTLSDPTLIPALKANAVYKLPTTSYLDLGASYNLTKSYRLVAGVNNLFDKEPPLGMGSSLNDYGTGFYGTYDPLGRYFHWGLQFSF